MIFIKKNGQIVRADGKDTREVVVIVSEDGVSGIIEDREIPELTEEQIIQAYNSMVAGKLVIVASENDEYFVIKEVKADAENGLFNLYYDFEETHIINVAYDAGGEEISYTAKEIGSGSGTGAVESVNGQTGVVVLTAEDIKLSEGDVRSIKQSLDTAFEEIERVEGLVETEETRAEGVEEDLQDQITNLQSRGRYLSNWNAITGLPTTDPTTELPYEYRQGDYFIVGTAEYNQYTVDRTYNTGDKVKHNGLYYECLEDGVSGIFDESKWQETTLVLYRPSGASYTGVASTVVETEAVGIGDSYIYDGTQWVYQKNTPVDLTEYYKKTETYSKGEVGGLLNDKADSSELSKYAKLEQGFNVINASDIASGGALTQSQYDLIKNGKPTLIKGTWLLLLNPIILSAREIGTTLYCSCVAQESATYSTILRTIRLYVRNSAIKENRISIFANKLNDKDIPSFLANNIDGQLVYRNNALVWLRDGVITDTTHTTFSGALTSNVEYQFTQPLTALNIDGLDITTGDNTPSWKIKFKVGSDFAFSSTPTLVWKDGTPAWSSLVGEEVEILIEPSLTANTFNAWLI